MCQLKVLVTGATGFIGLRLVQKLLDSDHEVIAFNRKISDALPCAVRQIEVGDLAVMDANTLTSHLIGVDVVIHAAARVHVMNEVSSDPLAEFRKVNLHSTVILAQQAAKVGVKRFIYLSTIKVNGEATLTGSPFTAEDEPSPEDPYGISKAEAERALFDISGSSDLEVVIIRPVLVYGPGVKANFNNLMRLLDKRLPLPLGQINNKRSLVALDNLVDLILTCLAHPAAANEVFLVSDDEDLSTTDLLRKLGYAMQKPAILIPVPAAIIKFVASVIRKRQFADRLTGSLQVDITKTKQVLGWKPPVTVANALQETADSYYSRR